MNNERTSAAQDEDQLDSTKCEDGPQDPLGVGEKTKKPKRQNPRELDDARYAALDCRAHSEQARALVTTVTNLVAEQELTSGARTNKRKKKQIDLGSAIERLLADLLLAQTTEKAKGYVYRSMRPEGFTEGDIGYRTFRRVVAELQKLGLIENHKGFQVWGEFGPYIRKATRFRATKKLLDLCTRHGVRVADFHQHFLIPLPEHPLQLRAASRRNQYGDKIRGRPIKFETTPLTGRLENEVKELNTFFDGVELHGGTHRGYLRVFNNGDHPNFDWNMGGRLYSHNEGNYQQMERADRLRMTINGEPVCEIDIRASYPTRSFTRFSGNSSIQPETLMISPSLARTLVMS
jgi:hypothetical protein